MKVVKAQKVEDMEPFDPATQKTYARFTVEHAKHFLENNPNAWVLDVRSQTEYDQGHLTGAVSFPYDFEKMSIEEELQKHSDRDLKTPVFAYGSKEDFHAIEVATRLRAAGFQFVSSLNGGIEDWMKLGLPVELKATAP
ncbi:MAG: rhodanese-like domain-containing protein [Verrucomicrobiales bacterium]|nr:rhodanese-like domain-containing protein [Verrucomicrobiales bacterium]